MGCPRYLLIQTEARWIGWECASCGTTLSQDPGAIREAGDGSPRMPKSADHALVRDRTHRTPLDIGGVLSFSFDDLGKILRASS